MVYRVLNKATEDVFHQNCLEIIAIEVILANKNYWQTRICFLEV